MYHSSFLPFRGGLGETFLTYDHLFPIPDEVGALPGAVLSILHGAAQPRDLPSLQPHGAHQHPAGVGSHSCLPHYH